MKTAQELIMALSREGDPVRAEHSTRFFKTGPGEYGAGDKFFGVTVPVTRKLVRSARDMSLDEVQKLLASEWHEARLAGCLVLVQQFVRAGLEDRQKIYAFYVRNAKRINNWDLVDTSAPYIVGGWLVDQGDWSILRKLAKSENLWEKRIAILATFAFTRAGNSEPTYEIAEILLYDKHDLMHKAVGWMLREAGKRVSETELELWLQEGGRYKTMPRTTLRYAIERLPDDTRKSYLRGEK
jgi:3-methyladenine DNA glycosylase AlkD